MAVWRNRFFLSALVLCLGLGGCDRGTETGTLGRPGDPKKSDKKPAKKTGKEPKKAPAKEPVKKPDSKTPKDAAKGGLATADWHKDADCRVVFFAVLEGLYNDGISNDIVDVILGKDKAAKGVKQFFVFRCKLCHAVYDAFAAYRARPNFHGSEANTFGNKALAADFRKRLKATGMGSTFTRVKAMGTLVQPWIIQKLKVTSMSEAAKKALIKRLLDLVEEGNQILNEARSKDPDYSQDWAFYGGCQACEAINNVARVKGSHGHGGQK